MPEPVEGTLLGTSVAFGGLGELGQSAVEPLLAAVLLRLARCDAIVADERIDHGVPNSWKAESKIGSTCRVSGSTSASQRSK